MSFEVPDISIFQKHLCIVPKTYYDVTMQKEKTLTSLAQDVLQQEAKGLMSASESLDSAANILLILSLILYIF